MRPIRIGDRNKFEYFPKTTLPNTYILHHSRTSITKILRVTVKIPRGSSSTFNDDVDIDSKKPKLVLLIQLIYAEHLPVSEGTGDEILTDLYSDSNVLLMSGTTMRVMR